MQNQSISLKQEVLEKIGNIEIVRPDPAATELSEGIHLEVIDEKSISWRDQNVDSILRKLFLALYVSKVISEGKYSPDLWANIHFSSYPLFDKGVNVFGKNPNSSIGWGKPVRIHEVNGGEIPKEIKNHFILEFDLIFKDWNKMLSSIDLFGGGVSQLSKDDPKFINEAELNIRRSEKVIWVNERFSLVIIQKPQLSGLHLVVYPLESFWNDRGGFKAPWQLDQGSDVSSDHIQGILEEASILIGAERILLEVKEALLFYNPEIHFSGNWALDLKPLTKEDMLKKELRIKPNSAMHGHLYATRNKNMFVSLPSRPQNEVPGEWEGIIPLSIDEETKVSELISLKLSSWLEQNASGVL